jgi:HSP20 family protein
MVSLREAMNRLYEESFVRPLEGHISPLVGTSLAVDIYEKDDALVVKAAVPGIKADDLDISVTGDVLTIKGETKDAEETKGENYHRRELRFGSFCRSIQLPTKVDVNKVDAVFAEGVVTLTFPKPEEKLPKSISIRVKK